MLQSNLRKKPGFEKLEYTWDTPDGQEIYAQKWDALENTRAVILLVHSLGEHSSRYKLWASRLASEGISVLTFDFRGHGQTEGSFGNFSNYNKLLDDLQLLVDKGEEEFPDVPKFIYGHGFGGNLVTNYVISKATNFEGVVLTSPWFEQTNLPPKLMLSTTLFFSKIMPWIESTTYVKPEHLSRELREVHLYKNDKLIHDKISLGLFRKTIEKGAIAKRSIYKINAPLLVMHGTADKVSACRASQDFIQNASDRTTYIEWEGAYHNLHEDIDKEKVFIQLLDWINGQITSSDD